MIVLGRHVWRQIENGADDVGKLLGQGVTWGTGFGARLATGDLFATALWLARFHSQAVSNQLQRFDFCRLR